MPSRAELVAHGRTTEEIAEAIENAVNQAVNYDDDGELVLIASKDGYDWGSDENEIVLENATVIAIVNH